MMQRLPKATPPPFEARPQRNSPSGHSTMLAFKQFSSSLASEQSNSPSQRNDALMQFEFVHCHSSLPQLRLDEISQWIFIIETTELLFMNESFCAIFGHASISASVMNSPNLRWFVNLLIQRTQTKLRLSTFQGKQIRSVLIYNSEINRIIEEKFS